MAFKKEASSSDQVSRRLKVTNPSGLHARPTSEIVRCAMRHKSEITIEANGRRCSATSIMDIMTADIRCGAEIVVTAIGPDAEKAIKALETCLNGLEAKGL
jgi:phosphotransferase system HPr (HPr) family protein